MIGGGVQDFRQFTIADHINIILKLFFHFPVSRKLYFLISIEPVHCADSIHSYCFSKHPSALVQTRALFCLVMKRDFQFTFARDGSSRLLSNVRQTHINLSSPKVTETRYRD